MATYTTKKTAYRPANPFAINTLVLPDASENNINCSTIGGQQNIMAMGDSMLVQRQDGSIRRYKMDAERSKPPGLIYMLPTDGQ